MGRPLAVLVASCRRPAATWPPPICRHSSPFCRRFALLRPPPPFLAIPRLLRPPIASGSQDVHVATPIGVGAATPRGRKRGRETGRQEGDKGLSPIFCEFTSRNYIFGPGETGRQDFCKNFFLETPTRPSSGLLGPELFSAKSCLPVSPGLKMQFYGVKCKKMGDKPSRILSPFCLPPVSCGISRDIRFCPGRTRPPLLMRTAPSYDIVKYGVLVQFCKTKLSLGALLNF